MRHAECALRTLRLGVELDAARLACELRQTAGRLGAAARRESRLAEGHGDWCAALQDCLAAVPIDPHRFVELDRRRRAAQASLERARAETQALRERERALRGALARAQHREDGLLRAARRLQAVERTRGADAVARELEDAWNARAAGAGG